MLIIDFPGNSPFEISVIWLCNAEWGFSKKQDICQRKSNKMSPSNINGVFNSNAYQ